MKKVKYLMLTVVSAVMLLFVSCNRVRNLDIKRDETGDAVIRDSSVTGDTEETTTPLEITTSVETTTSEETTTPVETTTPIETTTPVETTTTPTETTTIVETTTPVETILNVAPISEMSINIPAYSEREYNAKSAEFLYYSGSISESGQQNTYSFTASETGKYRCELSDMVSGFSVSMYVYDSGGNRLTYKTGISNGSGVTVSLTAGQTYTLSIKSQSGTGSYNVFIGMQKSTVDLSQYTIVHDATEYKEQEINYSYLPAVSGIYRFYIAQINNGITVSIYVYDAAGYRVGYTTNVGQNSGVTVTLEAGQTYTVVIKQSSNVGNFTMNIGPQQPTVDISDCTLVVDSTKYSGQINNYNFTAREDGVYRFQIDQINSGITVSLYLYDAAGYKVGSRTDTGQNSGITVTVKQHFPAK